MFSSITFGVVATEAIHPANNKDVGGAEHIEKSPPLRSLDQWNVDAGDAMVGDDLIDPKPCCDGLSALVLNRLIGDRDSAVKDRLQGRTPLAVSFVSVGSRVRRWKSSPTYMARVAWLHVG